MNWLVNIYSFILRCYPSQFRDDFSEEMQVVFMEAAGHARSRSMWGLAAFILHEALSLPESLVSVYLWSFRTGEAKMAQLADGPGFDEGGYRFTPWKDAIFAGLPHLLAGLVAGLPYFIPAIGQANEGSSSASILMVGIDILFILIVLASVPLVWRSGWPNWAASWYPYWCLVLLMGVLYIPILSGFEPAAITNNWLGNVVLPLLIAYLLYRVARQDRIRGLLAALPLMIACWIPMLEFVPAVPRGASWVGCFLLAGLAAMGILRLHRLGSGLALSLGVAALAGTVFASLGIYLGGMLPFSEPGPSPQAAFVAYVPTLLFVCGLALGPQLARTLRDLSSPGQHGGVVYRIALFGLLLMIASPLVSSLISANTRLPWMPFFAFEPYPEPMVYLGAAIYTTGYLILARGAWKRSQEIGLGYLGLLYVAPLCLPFALAVGIPAFVVIIQLPATSIPLLTGLGLLWIAASAWVVVRGARVLS